MNPDHFETLKFPDVVPEFIGYDKCHQYVEEPEEE